MQIICLSRGVHGLGKKLAEQLAGKLGYDCLGREQLLDQATDAGIPVGKIETAIMKRQPLGESLSIDVERYKAFVMSTLCERTLKRSLVYHGRAGHLVLPGVSHVLRIRAIASQEDSIRETSERLGLSWERAEQYLAQVNDDIRRWVRVLYAVDWQDAAHYDVTINLGHLTLANTASALVHVAQLPEFHATPASRQQLENLLLAARCRLAIGGNTRTRDIKASVHADGGNVTITYPPRQGRQASVIPEVIAAVPGIQSYVCTAATTSIAYVEERFDPAKESLGDLIAVAEKWNAAVDLVWLSERTDGCAPLPAERAETTEAEPATSTGIPEEAVEAERAKNGWILDDGPDHHAHVDHPSGLAATLQRLIPTGRAGALHTVECHTPQLLADSLRGGPYSLVVVGDVFRAKGEALRKRLKRDLVGHLSAQLRLPVISTEDLKSHYLFGPRQWRNLALYALLTVLMYVAVFTHQRPILEFLHEPGTWHRILTAAVVTSTVPIVAFIVAGMAHHILKLVKLE